jgi:uncharacterized protein
VPQSRSPPARAAPCGCAPASTLRLVNTFGSQVADFWAFAADDPREYLSMEHTRPASRRLTPRPDDPLVTNRRRPILTLAADSSPGVHDTLIAACDIHRYRQLGYAGLHDNCTDNLRMAMLAIGRRAAEIPCPFNIWMNTPPLPDGSIAYLAPVAVAEVEREPGRARAEQRAEGDAGVEDADDPADIAPAEMVHDQGRKQCHPSAVEDAVGERERSERPKSRRDGPNGHGERHADMHRHERPSAPHAIGQAAEREASGGAAEANGPHKQDGRGSRDAVVERVGARWTNGTNTPNEQSRQAA